MAAQAHSIYPQADTIIATFGDVTEDNDRIAQIEICSGKIPGACRYFEVRCWGQGPWLVAQGGPAHFTGAAEAKAAARRWVDSGGLC